MDNWCTCGNKSRVSRSRAHLCRAACICRKSDTETGLQLIYLYVLLQVNEYLRETMAQEQRVGNALMAKAAGQTVSFM